MATMPPVWTSTEAMPMRSPSVLDLGPSSSTARTTAAWAWGSMVVWTRRPPPSISASLKPFSRSSCLTSSMM